MSEEGELSPSGRQLRTFFNSWAERGGKTASMERHHAPITLPVIERMGISEGDRVLDLGCGSGWTARRMAGLVGPRGLVVGVDISDAMIKEAQEHPEVARNVRYLCAPAEHIPWSNDFFTHVLSVESFYYYPDQRLVLDELRRIVAPGGKIFLLMCIFEGHPSAKKWAAQLPVPVHVRTPEAYRELLANAGWDDAQTEVFAPDPAEKEPDEHAWACLVTARKP